MPERFLGTREVEIDFCLAAHRHLEDVRNLFGELHGLAHEDVARELVLSHPTGRERILSRGGVDTLPVDIDDGLLRGVDGRHR